jgi:hypothetical protein
VELRAEIDQGAPAEFADAAVRSVIARLTEAPTSLHQSAPWISTHALPMKLCTQSPESYAPMHVP